MWALVMIMMFHVNGVDMHKMVTVETYHSQLICRIEMKRIWKDMDRSYAVGDRNYRFECQLRGA